MKFDFPNVMTAGADDGLFDSSSDLSFDGSGSAGQNNSLEVNYLLLSQKCLITEIWKY